MNLFRVMLLKCRRRTASIVFARECSSARGSTLVSHIDRQQYFDKHGNRADETEPLRDGPLHLVRTSVAGSLHTISVSSEPASLLPICTTKVRFSQSSTACPNGISPAISPFRVKGARTRHRLAPLLFCASCHHHRRCVFFCKCVAQTSARCSRQGDNEFGQEIGCAAPPH
jgi:hypothetical protein